MILITAPFCSAGWNGTHWGMSAAEIKVKYPDAEETIQTDSKDKKADLCVKSYDLGGLPFVLQFWLGPQKTLNRVVLMRRDSGVLEKVYDGLWNDLTKKYGKPTELQTSDVNTKECFWKTSDTIITLTYNIYNSLNSDMIDLEYEDISLSQPTNL